MTGKLLKGFFWFCCLLILSIYVSCSDFDSFGTDLLNSNWINAKGIDTFNMTAGPADLDSTITYNNLTTLSNLGFNAASYPLGRIADPVFGSISADFGTQLRCSPVSVPLFLHNEIDSIVLSLRYDPALFYINDSSAMSFSVYSLKETLSPTTIYYSTHALQYDMNNKLGELVDYVPNSTDSVHINLDTIKDFRTFPQLRIPLDTAACMNIFRSYGDTVYTLIDSFTKVFNGIAVVCNKANRTISIQPENSDSKVTVYYHQTGYMYSSRQEFNMSPLAVKVPCYHVDNSNSFAQKCIDKTISGDSLLCMQGFTGRDIHLTIPYDNSWNGKFINFAVLQFYVADTVIPNYNIANYSLPGLLEIFDISGGTKIAIDDATTGLQTSYTRVFGGYPITQTDISGKNIYLYKMNITRHFQKSLRAKKPIDLIISPLFKLESPARTVFFGHKNSKYPAKLILTYSE